MATRHGQPIFVNLKSNTMKNTVQSYVLRSYMQIMQDKNIAL